MGSISVIVTVYNRFELTKRAVESVLGQTLPVSEVILVPTLVCSDVPLDSRRSIDEDHRHVYEAQSGLASEAKGEVVVIPEAQPRVEPAHIARDSCASHQVL